MENIKFWYHSKTVWGALIAIAASLLQMGGITIGADIEAELAEIAVTLSGVAGGLLAIYGRISARKEIGGRGGIGG